MKGGTDNFRIWPFQDEKMRKRGREHLSREEIEDSPLPGRIFTGLCLHPKEEADDEVFLGNDAPVSLLLDQTWQSWGGGNVALPFFFFSSFFGMHFFPNWGAGLELWEYSYQYTQWLGRGTCPPWISPKICRHFSYSKLAHQWLLGIGTLSDLNGKCYL